MGVLEDRHAGSESTSSRSPEDRLDSWKAIASYLGRGVRTVQRWEREEGLPVHRLAHEKRGSVYARRNEIDAWWESRRVTLAHPAATTSATAPTSTTAAETPASPAPERLTWISAATFWPALSSDGRLLAYVSDGGRDGTTPQIWLHQIGGSAVCLTSGAAERSHLAFSADDTRLVFTATDSSGQNVYAMPTLGGEPRVLKRRARAGRPSPDGTWLVYIGIDDAAGVRLAPMDGGADRALAPTLMDVMFAVWSPDSRHVLVQAHADPSMEPDYWLVAIDGSAVTNTGIVQRLRERGLFPLTLPVAWVREALVFSLITPRGVTVWRQRLAPSTLEPSGEPERLTQQTDLDYFATAGGGRVAFVSTHSDQNLWAVALDPVTGIARGALRRLTRGPGVVAHLSVPRDGRTLSHFYGRPGVLGIMLRDLQTGAETTFAPEPPLAYGYPTLSPSGSQLAYAPRLAGPQAMRPIFVASLADGTTRMLGDDFGSRPRHWVDERFIVVEKFGGRLHSVGLVDATNGEQSDLLSRTELSITNPRVSPDANWISFDAARPGGPPSVFLARMRGREPIQRTDWMIVAQGASHPFWSADGAFIYYLPTVPSTEFRNEVHVRRFDPQVGAASGDPLTAFSSTEMVIPVAMTGTTTPVATRNELIMVLGDFRGDVWMLGA
jgi:Tol biopolymer transport system component